MSHDFLSIGFEVDRLKLRSEVKEYADDDVSIELVLLFFGFGKFNANSSIVKVETWSGDLGVGGILIKDPASFLRKPKVISLRCIPVIESKIIRIGQIPWKGGNESLQCEFKVFKVKFRKLKGWACLRKVTICLYSHW